MVKWRGKYFVSWDCLGLWTIYLIIYIYSREKNCYPSSQQPEKTKMLPRVLGSKTKKPCFFFGKKWEHNNMFRQMNNVLQRSGDWTNPFEKYVRQIGSVSLVKNRNSPDFLFFGHFRPWPFASPPGKRIRDGRYTRNPNDPCFGGGWPSKIEVMGGSIFYLDLPFVCKICAEIHQQKPTKKAEMLDI